MHKTKKLEKRENNIDQPSLGRWVFDVHKIIQYSLGDDM